MPKPNDNGPVRRADLDRFIDGWLSNKGLSHDETKSYKSIVLKSVAKRLAKIKNPTHRQAIDQAQGILFLLFAKRK